MPVRGEFGNGGIPMGFEPAQYYDHSMHSFRPTYGLFVDGLDKKGIAHQFLPNTWQRTGGAWAYLPQDPKETIEHKLQGDLWSYYATTDDLYHLQRVYDMYFNPNPPGWVAWLKRLLGIS
jgi:hypothetical protein